MYDGLVLWRFVVYPFLLSFAVGAAQTNLSIPDLHTQASAAELSEIWTGAPTLTLLPQSFGARTGKIWVRKAEQGLVIVGIVEGPSPAFPASAGDLMKQDHVEVWLSLTPDPSLPVLGWGNQFENVELPKGEESCVAFSKTDGMQGRQRAVEKDCRAWVRTQRSYRAHFRRLFTRQWQLAPELAVESFSTPAYQAIKNLPEPDGEMPRQLEPKGAPQFTAVPATGGGYNFSVIIPWEIFPPSGNMTLRDIRLLVDVFSPAAGGNRNGPYSTTSPQRRYGDAQSFNLLHFDNPQEYQLTPCGYGVSGLNIIDQPMPGYFSPSVSSLVWDTFILENYTHGYAYEPSGFSPETRPTHFFAKKIGPEEYVCGPILRYKNGKQANNLVIKHTQQEQDASLGRMGPTSPIAVAEEGFAVHQQPDGTLLIKSGPRVYWSRFGSGQCGACPRGGMEIYALHPDGRTAQLFQVGRAVDREDDFDIRLSPDWSRITVYDYGIWRDENGILQAPNHWNDNEYCLHADTYKECGPPTHVPPPAPRTLHFPPAQ